jgi:hypothetical protein
MAVGSRKLYGIVDQKTHKRFTEMLVLQGSFLSGVPGEKAGYPITWALTLF